MNKKNTKIEFKSNKGSIKSAHRLGRGNSSGGGGECGRGHKGQKSRSGFSQYSGFEGGQTPLYRRLPKKNGFTNLFRIEYDVVNLDRLSLVFKDGDTVSKETLVEKGLVYGKLPIKILGSGDIKDKLIINVDKISKSAIKKLEKSGSKITINTKD